MIVVLKVKKELEYETNLKLSSKKQYKKTKQKRLNIFCKYIHNGYRFTQQFNQEI